MVWPDPPAASVKMNGWSKVLEVATMVHAPSTVRNS